MQQTHQLAPAAPNNRAGRREQLPAGLPEQLWPNVQPQARRREDRRVAARCLAPGPQSLKAARDFAADTLRDWGLRALSQDAAVIVSELVTNALRHGTRGGMNGRATGQVELILWRRAGQLV